MTLLEDRFRTTEAALIRLPRKRSTRALTYPRRMPDHLLRHNAATQIHPRISLRPSNVDLDLYVTEVFTR